MSASLTLPVSLGALPSNWSESSKSAGKLSSPTKHSIFPAGPSFIRSTVRTKLQRSFAEDDEVHSSHAASLASKSTEEELGPEFDGLGEEQESRDVLDLDAKEWKKQDHYAVLGLGHMRYKANDDHIRVAHRRKVLRHHPDKKANSGDANNDSFFKCIQKAHETLTNLDRRRQFDSIDWEIEDFIPDPKSVKPENFIKAFGPVFDREGRFSKKQPVPSLGNMESSKQEVEGFYDFWYNFDSWRSFEWHDKEVNEGSDSRDDKRFTEKKNKSERARRKKDDNTRLRELVDNVLAVDPRIKRIRAEEKAARDAKKNKGKAPVKLDPKAVKEAEDKKKAEEAKAAEEAKKNSVEDKAAREAAKKAKEAARKNLKKFKKAIQTSITNVNYFQPAGQAPSASAIEASLNELDSLCASLEPEEVKSVKDDVEKAGTDAGAVKAALAGWVAKAVAAGKTEDAKPGLFSAATSARILDQWAIF
ncbi:Zuotin and related molecular chaperones (DnaJ superfamily), contains DNA-binding domains [Phaffia rhodozyma]|uniref:Zuotin and related molecular chaperones (DnaJ superfamily), contains DNA-binding domains n=1 Tax=Phaffia rhodozyma TaxID=264483 RepID=A0A0F7SL72_PHARH|nr:Zuotin and related molecular chaperones (DnaJ superfamily), contains DNA-binding domains [Phaffia rhodozyma]